MTAFVFLNLKVHKKANWSNGNFAEDSSRNNAAYASLLHGNTIN